MAISQEILKISIKGLETISQGPMSYQDLLKVSFFKFNISIMHSD